jgi:hypothetical protein
MVSVRWLRHGRTTPPASPPRADASRHDVGPWLETLHRLAQGQAEERRRLVREGDATRARLEWP